MNQFFREHKIRAYAKGFISCLHVRRTKASFNGKQESMENLLPIRFGWHRVTRNTFQQVNSRPLFFKAKL